MNMIRYCFTFYQLDLFLRTQFSKNPANLPTKPSIQSLFAVFWQYYHMVLAFPLNVGLTLPFFHNGSPCPSGLSSLENHISKKTLETAEPFQFSPAEPVNYYRFRMWSWRNRKVQNFASIMRYCYKYTDWLKEDRANNKGINPNDIFYVVVQKNHLSLSLSIIWFWFSHILGNSIFTNSKPQFSEFTLDSLGRLCWVFFLHSSDKFYKFPIDIRPADSSRFPFPVKLEAFFVPANNSRGLDNNQWWSPIVPDSW